MRAISRLIASPSPLPPDLRLRLPSARWEAPEKICCVCGWEPRAAVLAARAPVGLLEGLEDDLLLVRLDADAGVADRERDRRSGAVQRLVLRAPPVRGERDGERDLAARGELERVGEQVLEHL